MTPEFALIERFFTRPARRALLGVGDDCALVVATPGEALAITTDMLVEGTHFLPEADPRLLGHKALAVNLSDLAAMGAQPEWFTLSIALPRIDEAWLAGFTAGLFALADAHDIELVGGDTTRGPLALSITAAGRVPAHLALRRDGATAGEDVWVSGATGDAALGLAWRQGRITLDEAAGAYCAARMDMPQPRVALGMALRGIATGAADVSDGLLADLGHILERSQLGAELDFGALPRSPALAACAGQALAVDCLLGGGDDYELVFTAPVARRAAVVAAGATAGVAVTRIGRIVAGPPQAVLRGADGRLIDVAHRGFDHFSS